MKFLVQFNGPGFYIEAPHYNAAIKYAERYLPLKKGWTTEVRTHSRHIRYVVVLNSKGRMVNSALVKWLTPAEVRERLDGRRTTWKPIKADGSPDMAQYADRLNVRRSGKVVR